MGPAMGPRETGPPIGEHSQRHQLAQRRTRAPPADYGDNEMRRDERAALGSRSWRLFYRARLNRHDSVTALLDSTEHLLRLGHVTVVVSIIIRMSGLDFFISLAPKTLKLAVYAGPCFRNGFNRCHRSPQVKSQRAIWRVFG